MIESERSGGRTWVEWENCQLVASIYACAVRILRIRFMPQLINFKFNEKQPRRHCCEPFE
jgi:hypothetical protein